MERLQSTQPQCCLPHLVVWGPCLVLSGGAQWDPQFSSHGDRASRGVSVFPLEDQGAGLGEGNSVLRVLELVPGL